MKKKIAFGVVAATLLVIGGIVARGWFSRRHTPTASITLYGNVDIRQVRLAFNDSERIDKVLVDEGNAVHAGQLVAQLIPEGFREAVAQAQANMAAQQQVVARLLAGSRPEEIAAARAEVRAAEADVDSAQSEVGAAEAEVEAAQANLTNAEALYRRQQTLAEKHYVSLQIRDDAQRAALAAKADLAGKEHTLAAKQKALATKQQVVAAKQQVLQLAVIGPRKEDIAEAQATLKSDTAALALAKKALADTQLYAPAEGVIQNRILEPGDMATPQTPVFTLALDNPLWVRAYLPEPELGKVALGMRAWIETDTFPGQRFPGWIGFISPVAEFTPKSVETTQLRSQLVYRVRVYACNPDHRLRLGMPATVVIPLADNPPHTIPAEPCATN